MVYVVDFSLVLDGGLGADAFWFDGGAKAEPVLHLCCLHCRS